MISLNFGHAAVIRLAFKLPGLHDRDVTISARQFPHFVRFNPGDGRGIPNTKVGVEIWRGKSNFRTDGADDHALGLVDREAQPPAGRKRRLDIEAAAIAIEADTQDIQARLPAALLAGLPKSTAGVSVNRFCSSGLQTIAMAANSIASERVRLTTPPLAAE